MTVLCRHPGCDRDTGAQYARCSRHDGISDHGDICHCTTPNPDHLGECARCRHLVLDTKRNR